MLRLSIRDRFDAGAAPPGLRQALVRAASRDQGEPVPQSALGFDELQAKLCAAQVAVARIFGRFCPEPEPGEAKAPPLRPEPSRPMR